MEHKFNVEVAKIVGVNAAIVLNNIIFWMAKNKANKKHYYDGHYWSYNSVKAFTELFPYWSKGQIRRLLIDLEKKNIIKTANYNKLGFDRTKWYTVCDKSILRIHQLHLSESTNACDENGKPIPYEKQCYNDKKHIINQIKNNVYIDKKDFFLGELEKYETEYSPELIQSFTNYWCEKNSEGRMRFENQEYWSMPYRLKRFKLGQKEWSSANGDPASVFNLNPKIL